MTPARDDLSGDELEAAQEAGAVHTRTRDGLLDLDIEVRRCRCGFLACKLCNLPELGIERVVANCCLH